MANRISDETLQAIRERVSIVEVVSGYVALKKAGRNHLGLCPFHGEKTPSFTVNDERGLFHCFGCGAGGTVFTFVMQADRVTFREAVETLARRAGVEIPRNPEDTRAESNRNALIEINSFAQRFFTHTLRSPEGSQAMEYLRRRGMSDATIERYGLGYSPAGRGLSRYLMRKRSSIDRAVEVGLLGRRTDGAIYDRFRGRVMFPIRDSTGRVVGFGGRTMGDEQPKYLNSPESTVFRKGSVLYGLAEGRDAIRQAGRIVLVEGYMDALALVQNGIDGVVATLGTALSANQLRLARRFANDVVAFFDGDRAGREAAARAFGVCVQADVWGLAAFLPEGLDPDTFVQKYGPEATRKLLETAAPLADFFLEHHMPGAGATIPQRAAAARVVGEVMVQMKDAAQFDLLVKAAAQRLGVDESYFREQRQASTRPGSPPRGLGPAPATAVTPVTPVRPEEVALLEAVVLDRAAAEMIEASGVVSSIENQTVATALAAAIDAWRRGGDPATVLQGLPAELMTRLSGALLGRGDVPVVDRLSVARDCLNRVRQRQQRRQATEMRARLQHAERSGDDRLYREELQRLRDGLRGRSPTSS